MQDHWKYKSLGIAAEFIGNQSDEDVLGFCRSEQQKWPAAVAAFDLVHY